MFRLLMVLLVAETNFVDFFVSCSLFFVGPLIKRGHFLFLFINSMLKNKKMRFFLYDLFIHSLFHSSIYAPIHSFIPLSIHPSSNSSDHPFIHSLIYSSMHSSIHTSIHSCLHPSIHPFIHAFILLSIHSFMHSCSHPFTPPCTNPCTDPFRHHEVHGGDKRHDRVQSRLVVEALLVLLHTSRLLRGWERDRWLGR